MSAIGAERGWILLLIFAVWSYDTGAYLVGKNLGRTKFLTHISPSKTYAGLVGGLVACTIIVGLILGGLGQPIGSGLILGPLLGLSAQAGDAGKQQGSVPDREALRREGWRNRLSPRAAGPGKVHHTAGVYEVVLN